MNNTSNYREFLILASEFVDNFFSEEDIKNPETLEGVDFSEYNIKSVDPLFLDMQDMVEWLIHYRNKELTIRIYDDGHHALVGDMFETRDVVLAEDLEEYGAISEVVENMVMPH